MKFYRIVIALSYFAALSYFWHFLIAALALFSALGVIAAREREPENKEAV